MRNDWLESIITPNAAGLSSYGIKSNSLSVAKRNQH